MPGEWQMRRCPECHALWIDPSPALEDLHLLYSSYYTHSAQSPSSSVARQVNASLTNAYIRAKLGYDSISSFPVRLAASIFGMIHPGGRDELVRPAMHLRRPAGQPLLLDIGCGNGEFLEYMRDLGWRVAGVEPDPNAAAVARARGLDVRDGDLFAQDLPSAHADVITLVHVIEHLPDPIATLQECRRILRPGGRIALATPNSAAMLHSWFGKDWMSLDIPRHLVLFDELTVRTALAIVKLDILELATSTRGVRGSWVISRFLKTHPKWDSSAGLPSLLAHLAAIPVQLRERFAVRRGLSVGEEIVVLAQLSDKS